MNKTEPTAAPDLIAHDLLAALLVADHPKATEIATGLSSEALLSTAHACIRGRRWTDAAWVIDRITEPTTEAQIQRTLCRNLAALQIYRPQVYQTIVTLPGDNRCSIAPAADGRPTILVRRGNGERVCLSPGNDPLANANQAMRNLKAAREQGLPLALCGIGDGYLFNILAHRPPRLFLNMEQQVFLIEPDAQVVFHCLMIHDYTGTEGPIQQRRFRWYIGPTWREDVTHVLGSEPYLPCPAITICQGLDSTPLAAAMRDLAVVMNEREDRLKAQVVAYYGEVSREEIASLFSPRPPRQPRVLLITTRFSTVLQYSTADTAAAFERLGWEARVLIEPSNHHRVMSATLFSELANFKPDVVFQIDHLRYEYKNIFPPTLPFVCWIQDHLPNLRVPEAAKSISANDFVLTDAATMYRSSFGYPRRQCISLTKLTRVPQTAPATAPQKPAPVDDLVFVSNASHVAQHIIAQRLDVYDGTAGGKALLAESAQKLVELYAAGQSVATYYDLLSLIRQVQRDSKTMISVAEFDAIAAWLFHPLNDSLYRQQALLWVRQVAQNRKLSFALYGSGWDKHPDFAPFARGPVQYGPQLEALTRASKFNLQIVPYHCLHQRLLDGLVAGGFYLVRRHIADSAARNLIDFLIAHAPNAQNLESAQKGLPQPLCVELNKLANLLMPAIATTEQDDPVEAVLTWRDMGLVIPGGDVLPHYGEVSFDNVETLSAAIGHFIDNPELRASVGREQRQSVIDRFTYDAGIARAVGKMHEILTDADLPPKSKIEQARSLTAEGRSRRAV